MPHRALVGACIVAIGLSALPAGAASTAIVASKDNTLYEDPDGILSNGSGQHLFVGLSGPFVVTVRRSVLAFDIAGALPPGAIIESAQLRLHMSLTISTDQTHHLHRLLADWGEGASDADGPEGAGFAAAPGDATWLHNFYDDNLWTNPGGDFTAAISASSVVGSEQGHYAWASSQLVADVQDMLDHAGTNFGWILMGGETSAQSAKRFDSRENEVAEFRPTLILSYKIPAPGALALLGIGFAAPRRRRR